MSIPVIDLFAGPGGLGEGFSAFRLHSSLPRFFDVRLSIEKDATAHKTLELRALFRSFATQAVPDVYYDYLRGHCTRDELFHAPALRENVDAARKEAVCAELGKASESFVDTLIRSALGGHEDWLLIGGPPCQAYSLVGRSRMKGEDPERFQSDPRHFLYREYLRVIRTHRPAVFVMENVKGLLSAAHGGRRMFDQIFEDLSEPALDLSYEIRSFVSDNRGPGLAPLDFVISSESFGVPQARHRVILLGVRRDFAGRQHQPLISASHTVSLESAIGGFPEIRSRVSKGQDTPESWHQALRAAVTLLSDSEVDRRIIAEMRLAVRRARSVTSTGAAFSRLRVQNTAGLPKVLDAWYRDNRLGGILQHTARGHMAGDLHRYLYASAFARVTGRSPKVKEFPRAFWPAHVNVLREDVPFEDRFRVQLAEAPSSTVVSHIGKDGHYFIHPDPSQCRSLTVREAARLQTFPDNYFFEGNQTAQYSQVGNAVPPYLALQLASTVAQIWRSPKSSSLPSTAPPSTRANLTRSRVGLG